MRTGVSLILQTPFRHPQSTYLVLSDNVVPYSLGLLFTYPYDFEVLLCNLAPVSHTEPSGCIAEAFQELDASLLVLSTLTYSRTHQDTH